MKGWCFCCIGARLLLVLILSLSAARILTCFPWGNPNCWINKNPVCLLICQLVRTRHLSGVNGNMERLKTLVCVSSNLNHTYSVKSTPGFCEPVCLVTVFWFLSSSEILRGSSCKVVSFASYSNPALSHWAHDEAVFVKYWSRQDC